VLADVAGRSSPPTGAAASNRRRSAVLRTVDRALLPHVQARPGRLTIYHHRRESIEAHLSIVFAAVVVSRPIEARTGWSIRKFVRTAQIRAGRQILPPMTHTPADLHESLAIIRDDRRAH
jgi:hypothetical protein